MHATAALADVSVSAEPPASRRTTPNDASDVDPVVIEAVLKPVLTRGRTVVLPHTTIRGVRGVR